MHCRGSSINYRAIEWGRAEGHEKVSDILQAYGRGTAIRSVQVYNVKRQKLIKPFLTKATGFVSVDSYFDFILDVSIFI